MLQGIKHLREFKRIPQGFPNTILLNDHEEFCFRTTVKLLSEEFTTEFDDILSDELNPLPMKGDPMRISLKLNVIPKKVAGARQVPLRYEEGADAVVQDLMNNKVIVPVSITTDWCSPAFFVPKADMIRVRLVTDYTHLNKYVKRPVHPFPCTAKILQAIPSTATCFAKLDVVHEYFQLALEPKSSLVTTFAGHIISDTGIRPDKKKFEAIKQFPTPSCIKDV